MAMIEMSDDLVARLNDLAPSCMQGPRKTTMQVHWIIEEHERLVIARNPCACADMQDEKEPTDG